MGNLSLFADDRVRERGAVFSPCRTYRYKLWREWDEDGPSLNVIGLNPSTADEMADDPTIRRCIGFAKAWGYGSLVMTNLFAFRSTDPRGLLSVVDPVGPDNDQTLYIEACSSGQTIAAWGAHPLAVDRSAHVRRLLARQFVESLGLTKSGAPKHPLYLPKTTVPQRFWTPQAEAV